MTLYEEIPCEHGYMWPHCDLHLHCEEPGLCEESFNGCPGGSRREVNLLAAGRAGVESGTIEGEVVEAAFSDGESVPSIPVTHRGPFLVIAVSEGTT